MVEIVLKKVSPALYQALGIFLPLITTNCAVLGVAILVIQKDFDLVQSIVYAFSTAIGFGLALTVFAGMREQMELSDIPKGMRGTAIVLVAAGLLSGLYGLLGCRWRSETAVWLGLTAASHKKDCLKVLPSGIFRPFSFAFSEKLIFHKRFREISRYYTFYPRSFKRTFWMTARKRVPYFWRLWSPMPGM